MDSIIRKYIVLPTNAHSQEGNEIIFKSQDFNTDDMSISEIRNEKEKTMIVKDFSNGEKEIFLKNTLNCNNLIRGMQQFVLYGYNQQINKYISGAFGGDNSANRIILPTEFTDFFIESPKDLRMMEYMRIFHTENNSCAIPIEKSGEKPCLWSQYGESFKEEDKYQLEIKILNLRNIYTCAKGTPDIMRKQEFIQQIITTMTNNIQYEILRSIFKDSEDQDNLPSIMATEKKLVITDEKKNNNKFYLWGELSAAIALLPSIYRSRGQFFMSREFFNEFINQLMEEKHTAGQLILHENKHMYIMGYPYHIVEEIQGKQCIFGDIKEAYAIVQKSTYSLDRDEVTEKGMIKLCLSTAVAGMLIKPEAVVVIKEEAKD